MATAQKSDHPDRVTFRTYRVLPYQPQSVFEAFARPELLARWWGPAGFTNTFEVFEVRHIVEPANEQNLDRLVSVLADGQPAA